MRRNSIIALIRTTVLLVLITYLTGCHGGGGGSAVGVGGTFPAVVTSVTFTIGINNPENIAIDSSGNAWVTNYGSNTVSVLSSTTGTVVNTYPTGTSPVGIAIDSSGNVWVTNYGSNTVSELSSTTGTVVNTYSTGTNPVGIAIDSSENVWITNYGSNTVSELSSTTGAVLTSPYPTGTGPYNLTIDASNNVWVANSGDNTVTEISSGGTNTITVGSEPTNIIVDPSLNHNLWVTNSGDSTVTELSPSGETLGIFVAGSNPRGAAVNTNYGDVWITSYGTTSFPGNTILVLNSNGVPVYSYTVGFYPTSIEIDNATPGNVWIANYGSNSVTLLQGASPTNGYHSPVGPVWP
jgi:YVTN family beta-propeller protein